jgi:TldD protein
MLIELEQQIALDYNDFEFLQDLANEQKITYFNARFSQGENTILSLLKGVTKSSSYGIGRNFSIQAFKDGGYGMAIGQEFTKDAITAVFKQAAKLALWSSKFVKEPFQITLEKPIQTKFTVPQKIKLDSVGPDEKTRFLVDLSNSAADYNPKIISTQIGYSDSLGEKILYNSAGSFIRGNIAQNFIYMQVIAKNGQNQQGFVETNGSLGGYDHVKAEANIGINAASQAVEMLQSKPIKAGMYNIIMDPTLTGTFIHEAFGHACEADGVLSGESILAGKIGEKVGASHVSIIDDGTIEGSYGWVPYDDEGIPGHRTELVKNGILTNYLHSLETASKMNTYPTGNARAGSSAVPPIVRMTNTFLAPGDSTLDEMIHEMKNGLLCVGWVYGYVEPSDGSFMFKMKKAYRIENGEKKELYRDAAISGLSLDVLNKVGLLSKTIEKDVGTCGKDGQSAPVTSGGPYTFISDMVIGGQ